jgi:uncharacterized GH25 family protein
LRDADFRAGAGCFRERARQSANVLPRLAITLVLATTTALAQAEPQPAAPAVARSVTGRVLAADETPIAGARLWIGDFATMTTAEILRREEPITAADGTFTISWPRRDKPAEERDENEPETVLVVAAKGHASCIVHLHEAPLELPPSAKPFPLGDLTLAAGQRLVGRVRDAGGRPVANASVTVRDLLPSLFHDDEREFFQCGARTDAGGIFDLPCALAAGSALTIEADGYFTARRQPVAAGTPLEVELQPSGWLEGHVHGGDQPIANAAVTIHYEAHHAGQTLRTDAAGAFRAPLRHPGRWRIDAVAKAESGERRGTSKAGEGADATIRVDLAAATEPDTPPRRLQVLAVAKGTGTAIRNFRAAVQWGADAGEPWQVQQLQQRASTAKPTADGSVDVPGPGEDAASGVVCVIADGHAAAVRKDLTWNDAEPKITVELEPEATVSGVARDAATGQLLANARVMVQRVADGDDDGPTWLGTVSEGGPRTAADGTFRIGQLHEGKWQLRVHAEGRPMSAPLTVTLKAGEAKNGVTIDVPAGVPIGGKLIGEPIGAGWRVMLTPVAVGMWQGGVAVDDFGFGHGFGDGGTDPRLAGEKVGADGTFAFTGQSPGHYTLLLRVPSAPRCGTPLFVPIDSFRVRDAGLRRDFDMTGDRAVQVRGRITFPEAVTSFDNLVISVQPSFDGHSFYDHYGMNIGARTLAGRDGGFTLPVIRGKYRLVAFDLTLQVQVGRGDEFEVTGADVEQNLAVPLRAMTFELKPTGNGPMAVVDRMEVRCADNHAQGGWVMVGGDDDYDSGNGVLLPRRATSITLALPHGDVTLLLRNHADGLRLGEHDSQLPPLGKLELQIPGDGKTTAVIEVAPPPELGEEAAPTAERGR